MSAFNKLPGVAAECVKYGDVLFIFQLTFLQESCFIKDTPDINGVVWAENKDVCRRPGLVYSSYMSGGYINTTRILATETEIWLT